MTESHNEPSPGRSSGGLDALRGYVFILHVNDSTDDQVLFQAACSRAMLPILWHVTDSAAKGISYLETLLRMSKDYAVRWPDVVLLDVVMPGGSGLEVLRFIREHPELKSTYVVILTGHGDPEIEQQAIELGVTAFLKKPLAFDQTVELAKTIYGNWQRTTAQLL